MNRTMILGGVLLTAGFITHANFTGPIKYDQLGSALGGISLFVGAFLLWNGYVANYNDDIGFALLG
ncbi:MAG: hypothetical protein ACR2M9_01530 [Cyanophyceae cyanobacterium]